MVFWVLALAFIVSVACTEATSGTSAQPAPRPHADAVAEGKALYGAKGCAVCHGQNGEGTSIAPALPGHTAAQVRRQVRAPRLQMPAFGPSQVSDEELGKIAAYIESLGPGGAHVEPTAMPGLVAMHHWMAILALDAKNEAEAKHHVGHIIELVHEPGHRREMEEALALLNQDHLHDAEHMVEGMLAGTAVLGLTLDKLHLQLALMALEVKDTVDLKHHLEHFLGQAPAPLKTKGQELLELLAAQRMHDLEEELRELLGVPRHR